MVTSKYNFYFSKDNRFFIYNILSTSIIEVENDTWKCLKNDEVTGINNQYISDLKNLGFIDENKNQEDKYMYYYNTTRYNTSSSDLRIMFIPTYNCNLRCPYCYEGKDKKTEYISKAPLDTIIKFVEKQIEESYVPIEILTISLFGGEPMLCGAALEYFCEKVNNLSLKYNTKVRFDITTNFTLLNKKTLELINKYKISVQVTIDGPKEIHDTKRIDAIGNGTYDKIINNLETALAFGLKDLITIRINTDEDNAEKCVEVFKEMQKYSNDVYFGILNKYSGRNDEFTNKCLEGNDITNIFVDKFLKLYKECKLEIPVKFGKKNPCSMNSINKFMIDYKLNVYKCDLLVNCEPYKVGIILDNGTFVPNSNYYKQMSFSPENFDSCKMCKFLPMCASNCPAEKILKEERKDGSIPCGYCMVDDQKLETYLKSYIDLVGE